MTERSVTIDIQVKNGAAAAALLADIKAQRDALLKKQKVRLDLDAGSLEYAQKSAAKVRSETAATIKDLDALGNAITSKAVTPLAQYQKFMGAALHISRTMGSGTIAAMKGLSAEFIKHRDLAKFWGTGYINYGIDAFRRGIGTFLSTAGSNFTSWLQNISSNLAQVRTGLIASAAAMMSMAAVAGLSSKHQQNYIASILDSKLMARKLTDKAAAASWIQAAQGIDWSAGRESRTSIFQTVLSKNPYIGQKGAQKATEDIEKFFFANQEMLRKKGFETAEQLASEISAPQLTGEAATKFEDIFGLGFAVMTPQARLGRLSTAAEGIDINKAMSMRPDEILTKRLTATTQAMGDAVIPVLNAVLGLFIDISNVIAKIPGLGAAMGWAAVLGGIAAAGLVVVSVIGSLVPGLITMINIFNNLSVATKIAAAAQWLLNAAMAANPLGIAIIAIVGLIAGLYMLEKRFGLVTKAWQAFSNSSIGKGIFAFVENAKKIIEDLLGTLGKAFTSGGLKGVMKIALEGLAAGNPIFKMIIVIVDIMKKLWAGSTTLNKLFSSGLALWQKVADFFSWLKDLFENVYNALTGLAGDLVDKIRMFLPNIFGGYTEEEKAAREAGIEPGGIGWPGAMTEEQRKENLKKWNAMTPEQRAGVAEKNPSGFVKWLQNLFGGGETTTASQADAAQVSAIPAEEMKTGTGGYEPYDIYVNQYGDTRYGYEIAKLNTQEQALWHKKGALSSSSSGTAAPGKDTITNAATGEGIQGSTKTKPGKPSGTGGLTTPRQFEAPAAPPTPPSFDVGGKLTTTGSLIGHAGEEIDPAQAVKGGKTTLAKINELIGSAPLSGQTINFSPAINVQIDKISSDVDIDNLISRIANEGADRLFFAWRSRLENLANRGIGYMRG